MTVKLKLAHRISVQVHIDYIKTKVIKFLKIENSSLTYWLFQTFDQILHYGTYLLIVYVAANGYSLQNVFEKFISFF